MGENLVKATTNGILWSFMSRFMELLIQFLLIAVLSRFLTPEDFASVGLLTVFSLLSSIIIDSGFGQALIRKTNLDNYDLSSVFYFNVIVGCSLYCLLYIASPFIADFYKIPELNTISKLLFLRIIFYSLTIIPQTILARSMNFKKITISAVSALTMSAIIGIVLAFLGVGVYSLVFQLVSQSFFNLVFLTVMVGWHPLMNFKWQRVQELLGFSLNLLGTGLITVFFNNFYTLLIGRLYPQKVLGYYSQAKKLEDIPSQSITNIIQNVSYSSMSKVKDDNERLKRAYKKILFMNIFIVLPIMALCFVSCDNFIPILLGEKWNPIIPFFRVLCVYGALFPLFSVNTNILKVKGFGKLVLRQEVVRRIFMLISILVTYQVGVIAMLWGWVISMVFSILYSFRVCGKPIAYNTVNQLKDLFPYFVLAISVALAVFYINTFHLPLFGKLSLQIALYILLYMTLARLIGLTAYEDICIIIRSFSFKQLLKNK